MNSRLLAFAVAAAVTTALAPVAGLDHFSSLVAIPVWLLFMVLATLPLQFLEVLLVRRAKALPWQGIASLTRDADAPTFWRWAIPAAMWSLVGLAGWAMQRPEALTGLQPSVAMTLTYVPLIVALPLIWLNRGRLLLLGLLVALISWVLSFLDGQTANTMQLLTPAEWRQLALAALLSNGAGLGIVAWLALDNQSDSRASQTVVPVWLGQMLAGSVVLLGGQAPAHLAPVAWCLPTVILIAIIGTVLQAQALARGYRKPFAFAVTAAAIAGASVLALSPWFAPVLKMEFLVTLMALSGFVGWVMKISHARKALNMNSELSYNVWRIAVRLVVPVICVWLLVGLWL